MDSAVTVVEWGRGRVEHLSDSRLEVELHRTRGGAAASAETPETPETPAETGASPVLDFDTDDDDEPRTVVIRGFGPRWAEAPTLPGPETMPGAGPLPGTTPQTPERNP
jgi:tRNA threonylcarbamoyladenosine biosynthesis protein TsaE